ncbi:MAG TPA: helix-turn-helix domain-containing protein [Chryseolinea sp.]
MFGNAPIQKDFSKRQGVQVVTFEDLKPFKEELLEDIKMLLVDHHSKTAVQTMRSKDVCQALKISPGTLRNYRLNGRINFTKIGRIIFYNYDDICHILKR